MVEADDENLIASLVASGMGMALMREDVALKKARAKQVVLWQDVRLRTSLQFLHLRSRAQDPAIRALVEALREVWALPA